MAYLSYFEPHRYSMVFPAPTTFTDFQFSQVNNIVYSIVHQSFNQRFNNLAATWKLDTKYSSSVDQIVLHPAYQELIGMGEKIIPFILQDLQMHPNQWFWALKSVTGADPVPSRDRGDIDQMTKHWLAWGDANGYI